MIIFAGTLSGPFSASTSASSAADKTSPVCALAEECNYTVPSPASVCVQLGSIRLAPGFMVASRAHALLLPLPEPADASEWRRSTANALAPWVDPARESTVVGSSFSWADDLSSDWSSDDDSESCASSVDSAGASIHGVADSAFVDSEDGDNDCPGDEVALSILAPARRRGNVDPAAAEFTSQILATSIKMQLGSWAHAYPLTHSENTDDVAPIQIV